MAPGAVAERAVCAVGPAASEWADDSVAQVDAASDAGAWRAAAGDVGAVRLCVAPGAYAVGVHVSAHAAAGVEGQGARAGESRVAGAGRVRLGAAVDGGRAASDAAAHIDACDVGRAAGSRGVRDRAVV